MQQYAEQRRSKAFLDEQLDAVNQKRSRLEHALNACGECLEAEGLRASLANAELERDVLRNLADEHARAESVSLDALIMQKLNCLRRTMDRVTVWRRGQRTPPAYWEAEIKRGFLSRLLAEYHAFEDARPYYTLPQPARNGDRDSSSPADADEYPWYYAPDDESAAECEDEQAATTALEERIQRILETAQYPPEHLEIVIEPDEPLLITGYAHSREIREALLDLLLDLEGVQDVVSDIQVVQPAHCPVCLVQRGDAGTPSTNGRNWLHRRFFRRNGHRQPGRNGHRDSSPADE